MSESKTIKVSPDLIIGKKSGSKRQNIIPSKVHDNLNQLKKKLLEKLQETRKTENKINIGVQPQEVNSSFLEEKKTTDELFQEDMNSLERMKDKYEEKYKIHEPPMQQINVRNCEEPKWGCLKNGNKPTYSKYKTLKKNSKARFKRKTRQVIGKNNKTRKVKICIRSKPAQQTIKRQIKALDKKPLKEIIQYMKSRNLLKGYTEAPEYMIRDMYKQCVLSGDIKNNNRKKLVQHYLYS